MSVQIKPQDEFTQYGGTTEIREAVAQFKNLPNYFFEFEIVTVNAQGEIVHREPKQA